MLAATADARPDVGWVMSHPPMSAAHSPHPVVAPLLKHCEANKPKQEVDKLQLAKDEIAKLKQQLEVEEAKIPRNEELQAQAE